MDSNQKQEASGFEIEYKVNGRMVVLVPKKDGADYSKAPLFTLIHSCGLTEKVKLYEHAFQLPV